MLYTVYGVQNYFFCSEEAGELDVLKSQHLSTPSGCDPVGMEHNTPQIILIVSDRLHKRSDDTDRIWIL